VTVANTGSKVTTMSWVVAGGFAAWAAARLTAADRVRRTQIPAVPLLAVTPQVAAAAPWAALGLRLARRRGPAATAALAATALGLAVRPRGIARPQPKASGPVLRVLTVNLWHGRGDAEAVVARAREASADVLFVQELTADAVDRLRQAGLDDLMPHTRLELRRGSGGSGIYSRFPLSEGPSLAPVRAAQPTALLELPGGEAVELICVHPSAPALRWRDGAVRWRAELAVLPPPGGLPRVVAGDFNATIDHAAFRDVLRLGYADAARQAGEALTPTWGLPGKGALLTLDHVLVDRSCAVLACSVHAVPGSDHRAVYAAIQLPGR
jgi:endonuclease/exonuclease/phosphatase family metal-dependent hydrolase